MKRPAPGFYPAARPSRPPAAVPPPLPAAGDDSPTAGDRCWGCGETVGEGCEGLCPIPRSRMRGMVEEIARLTVEVGRLKSLVEFQQTALNARGTRGTEAKTVAVPAVRK